MLPCRRFADVLADARARLGADVGRYSFIAVDFHHILLAGLPAHSLALRPAHSRRHLYVSCYTEGFSHFVTSMTAPVASGWSVRRVGLAPTGKRRLVTAHANSGRSRTTARTKSPIRSTAEDVAELLPTRAVEGGELRLADRAEIVGRGINLDARQQHRQFEVLQVSRLLHDVVPRQVVTALLEHLNHRRSDPKTIDGIDV